MNDLLLLKELDQRYRQVCGLVAVEKERADKLQKRVEELEAQLVDVCRALSEREV